MRNKRFPKYPDDADYSTNANSYYDDLARKQKLIQLLAEKIWEYDERLNDRLDNLEQVLTSYLDQWDWRIENLDKEVSHIFVTWLEDGTLEQIINHDVLGNKADQSELDKTNIQLDQIALNVKSYGAIGDGDEHPLSDFFDTLEDAQEIYPFVTSLENQMDWCAFVLTAQMNDDRGGGTILIPDGEYVVDFTTIINTPTTIYGSSRERVIIKLADQSRLFHNENRNSTNDQAKTYNDLYRDYHAMFFVNDVDFNISGVSLDGNPKNQTIEVGYNTQHYAFGSQTPNTPYYKFTRGIAVYYEEVIKPRIVIKECEVGGFSWTNINISHVKKPIFFEIDGIIKNNVIRESSHDQLNFQYIKGLEISGNTFINPNTHSAHGYGDVKDITVHHNKFILNDNIFKFLPFNTSGKSGIVMGHENYENFRYQDIRITNNFVRNNSSYDMFGVLVNNNGKDVIIEDNKMINVVNGFSANRGIVSGINRFKNNHIEYYSLGLTIRLFNQNNNLLKPDESELYPLNSFWEINSNTFIPLDPSSVHYSIDLRTSGNTITSSDNVESVHYLIKDNIGERYAIPTTSDYLTYDKQDLFYNDSGERVKKEWHLNRQTFDAGIEAYEPDTITYRTVSPSHDDFSQFPNAYGGLLVTYATAVPTYSYQELFDFTTGEVFRRFWKSSGWTVFS